MDMASNRTFDWPGCVNARDLGGLPLGAGQFTRRGSIARADLLGRLTPAGKEAALTDDLRTIIDMRTAAEIEREPTAFFPPATVTVVQPSSVGFDPALLALLAAAPDMGQEYIIILDQEPSDIIAALRATAAAPPGLIAIHCHSGKDRTGLVSALLLALCGVPDATIAADYALSGPNLLLLHERHRAAGLLDPHEEPPNTPPHYLLDLLAHLRHRYGGIVPYLLQAGLTPAEIDALRARLLPAGFEVPAHV
jgi:hypothetical protein